MDSKTQRRTPAALAAALALLAWAEVAAAEQVATDNELLRQGLALYEELEYERVVEVLSAALLEPGNDLGELREIYRTLGIVYVLLGRETEARLALTRLVCTDRDFAFDEMTSPRIRSVFDRVRAEWETAGRPCAEPARAPSATPASVEMDHESPSSARAGEALELTATIADPELRVHSVLLHYRASGEASFDEVPAEMDAPGHFAAAIPSDAVRPPSAEYYLRAVDDAGRTLAASGTSRAPLRVPVSEVATTTGGGGSSVLRSWWLWTIVGAVVVGVAVGVPLGVVYGGGPGPEQRGTLTVTVCDAETGGCP